MNELTDKIDWQKMGGLIPAIVQDTRSLAVLMLGYMNREALAMTLATSKVTFFSRSRQTLWTKGETSGHTLTLKEIRLDCDGDTLLVGAHVVDGCCHTGAYSCFFDKESIGRGFLGLLDDLIAGRKKEMPEGSYTTRLLQKGINRIAQKVGEEAVETVIAAKDPDDAALAGEAADLVYHLIVLLHARGMSLATVARTLQGRHP